MSKYHITVTAATVVVGGDDFVITVKYSFTYRISSSFHSVPLNEENCRQR
ncbi:MAG TPA: hypothetical protein VE445_10870 [Nitrososphaeraceae archaeon]|nr:hypothetical protein [Nitrososphaeraceae archaeon]